MNELSLFTGAGGGLLGTKLLGFRPIGYVEWDGYCQAIIAQRIKDGFLEEAPIFGDIRKFVESGAAREYRGFADVVTAGFPCQPFSVAGKQLAADDERNMWPATRDVIRVVRPRFAFLENVPGLLSSGYFSVVISDLAALGFDAEWGVFSAAGSGAPHLRERVWILAYANESRAVLQGRNGNGADQERHRAPEIQEWENLKSRLDAASSHEDVADSKRNGRQGKSTGGGAGSQNGTQQGRQAHGGSHEAFSADAWLSEAARFREYCRQVHAEPETAGLGFSGGSGWWATEPGLGRVANGVAHRVDRLKAIGNGQVPYTVISAWQELSQRISGKRVEELRTRE